MTNTQWATYEPTRETQYCAICGHIIPTDEEEHAKVGIEYLCETCASSSEKLLQWIGGIWCD